MEDQADSAGLAGADTSTLVRQLPDASPGGQDTILTELYRRAQDAATAGEWMAYADGLSIAGRHTDALDLRIELAGQLADGPDLERLQLGQAFDHMSLRDTNLARQEFGALAGAATDPAVRDDAARQAAGIDQWRRDLAEDMRWRQLKAAALRERIAAGPAGLSGDDDHYQLCHALIGLWSRGDPGTGPDAVDEATAAALAAYPGSADLRELRVLFLMRSPDGRDAELDDELLALERLDPDAPVLRGYAEIGQTEQAEHHQEVWDRLRSLLQAASQPDPGLQAAAMADLRALAQEFPQNTEVRGALGLVLSCTGHPSEALEHAAWLEPRAGGSHELHLTLGQLFWQTGDHERGREHFGLASQYAASDADHANVDSVRAGLGA